MSQIQAESEIEKTLRENQGKALDKINTSLGKTLSSDEIVRRAAAEKEADDVLHAELGKLIAAKPLFGTVFVYINKRPSWSMPTMAVGSQNKVDLTLYYNPDFLLAMSRNEVTAILIHEAMHILLHHLVRGPKSGWHPRLANVAMDMAINPHIDGIPEWGVHPKQVNLQADESADSYYAFLKESAKKKQEQSGGKKKKQKGGSGNQQGQGGGKQKSEKGDPQNGQGEGDQGEDPSDDNDGDGKGKSGTGAQKGQHGWNAQDYSEDGDGDSMDLGDIHDGLKGKKQWDDHSHWGEGDQDILDEKMRGIAKKAMEAQDKKGWSEYGSGLMNLILEANKPVIDWKRTLKYFMSKVILAGKRSTIMRPHRRYGVGQPGKTRDYKSKLLLAVDVSGSVSDKEYQEIMSEVNGMVGLIEIHLIFFDTILHGKDGSTGKDTKPIIFDKKQARIKREYAGGTDFGIVFDFANQHKYDGLIMLTDGYCGWPPKPKYQVLWALTMQGKEVQPPFGKRVVIETK